MVIEAHSGTHMDLADLASRNSALSVGIGVDEQAIVLTYKNIPAHQFIYRLTGYAQYPDSLRTCLLYTSYICMSITGLWHFCNRKIAFYEYT